MRSFMNPIESREPPATSWVRLDEYVAEFEAAWNAVGHANVRQFLPEPAHPLYDQVLCELVRVALELGWQSGQKPRLEDYRAELPELFSNPESLAEVAFEEYRQRVEAGERPIREEYAQQYGVDTSLWLPSSGSEARSILPEERSSERGPGEFVRGAFALDGSEPFSAKRAQASWAADALAHAAISYQAFRLKDSQEDSRVDSWCSRYEGAEKHAQLFREVHKANPADAERLARAIVSFPAVGSQFLGFQLLHELGRGAFGRVYLAAQPELANRLVALKVASDIFGESQTLAQLQHTNIVPIHSVHKASPFQAVCMPFFGSATLADLLHNLRAEGQLHWSGKVLISTLNDRKQSTRRGAESTRAKPASVTGDQKGADSVIHPGPVTSLAALKQFEEQTYVDVVLWLGIRLADGLSHAHERGILHRDLKPANVLLTDDGQPMLLDFNLSEDTKQSQAAASIGGTLPYMAPEHLRAFKGRKIAVDARADLYSLGVILFELLTGHHPFQDHSALQNDLDLLISTRLGSPPRLRALNREVSPALEAIIRRCLEPNPADRYQTARQLLEDLEQQKDDLPLKHTREPSFPERFAKWRRRHPRMGSALSMGVVAFAVIAILASTIGTLNARSNRHEARSALEQLEADMRDCQALLYSNHPELESLSQGMAICQEALQRYQVTENPSWREAVNVRCLDSEDQLRLQEDLGEMLYMLALATNLQAHTSQDRAQRLAGVQLAMNINRQAEAQIPQERLSGALWRQRADFAEILGDILAAQENREKANKSDTRSVRDLYLMGHELTAQCKHARALPLLREATRRDPRNFSAWLVQGNCHYKLGQTADAIACYSACIALRPTYYGGWLNRGIVYLDALKQYDWARADFDQVIAQRPDLPDAYINRALTYQAQGKLKAALADFDAALERGTTRTRIYFLRARVRANLKDKTGAEKDFEEAMRLEPQDEQSWIARGLARLDKEPKPALADFDEALRLNPRSVDALQNKANVLSDLLGQNAAAISILDQAIKLAPDYVPAIAGRGVLRARLGMMDGALEDAREALLRNTDAPNLYQVAGIYALRSVKFPEERVKALQLLGSALRSGFGTDLVDIDHELDPIRNDPEFVRMVSAAKVLRAIGKLSNSLN